MVKQPRDQKRPIDLKAYGMGSLSLRIWHGMALDAWLRVMRGKWHLVSPSHYPLVAMITLFSVGNQFLKWATILFYGRRLSRVQISPTPIFVIGHWRSGTTWLHSLLMADPRHGAPDNRACFSPETFLAGRPIVTFIMRLGMPKKRPMDNVLMEVDAAQEDEIGLCLSGAVSLSRNFMFPLNEMPYPTNPTDMSPKDRAHWHRKWREFLTRVQFANPGKRLVLKSPTHTTRIAEVLKVFPDAQFIHIVRDPYKIFLSRRKQKSDGTAISALQDHLPSLEEQDASIIARFVSFHEEFERQKPDIPADQITTIRYEDLKADTTAALRQVYRDLNLDEFPETAPEMMRVLQPATPYQNNQYELDDDTRELVEREFKDYFKNYGYLPMAERPRATS